MAGKTDLGGIFFKLGLDLDKNSFESGNKLIDNTSINMNKLIGTARNAAVALLSMKTIGQLGGLSDAESAAYKTAEALGVTTETLAKWKAAAKIAGVDANSLVNSMGQLGSVISHIKIDGRGLDEYSKKLQEIGLGITDLKDKEGKWLSADKAFEKIIAKGQEDYANAKTKEEQLLVITKMGDILGNAGQDFFIELTSRLHESVGDFLIGAKSSVYTTNESNEKAAEFAAELRELTTTTKSILALFGTEIAGEMTPYLDEVNKFIKEHKNEIITGINTTAKAVGVIATETALIVNKLFNWGKSEKGQNVISGLEGLFKSAILTTFNLVSSTWEGNFEKASSDLANGADDMMESLQLIYKGINGSEETSNVKKTKDGILRPDGTLTQVAPDDWVFAVRNIGDMARAFIPPMPTQMAGSNEFVINQTFNISGSSDLPQVIRQQAYNGTQEGLMNIMAQSSQRLQLMSGTR